MKSPILASGQLPVSHGHSIYFELVGNPQGRPVIYFHGGPGSGFDESDYSKFDLKKFLVLFFDQRGSGASKPNAELKNNTTPQLIADAVTLMNLVGFEKALFYGTSWGSTLALLTAIAAPERCAGIIIAGVFLATKEASEYFTSGAWRMQRPEVWEQFISIVPRQCQQRPFDYYVKNILNSSYSKALKFAQHWLLMELSLVKPALPLSQVKKYVFNKQALKFAKIECHYLSNNYFVPENFILSKTNALKKKALWIVHGRNDLLCPAAHAYTLHKQLPQSKLILTDAGHSSSDTQNCVVLNNCKSEYLKLSL